MTPNLALVIVASSTPIGAVDFDMALIDPGRQLRGAAAASEFFIYPSERSTFNPPPNLKKELKDL